MQEGFPPEHSCELFTHSLEHLLVLVFSVATQIHMSGQSKRQENDETLPNFVKKKEAKTKEGREKETRGKDQSPGKQTAQQRRATMRKGNH
jgi:hypothetical protein